MQKIDLHQDVISSFKYRLELFKSSDSSLEDTNAGGLPDYKIADLQIVFASVWPYQVVPDSQNLGKKLVQYDTSEIINQWKQYEELRKQNDIHLILSGLELESTKYLDFRLNFVYHLKGMDNLKWVQDLENLKKAGFRSVQLVWEFDNDFAHCHRSSQWWLSEKWKDVLNFLDKSSMLIDTANMNYESMVETYQFTKKPIMNSHTNVFALYSHSRNVADNFLELINRSEWLIWLSLTSNYMVPLDQTATIENYLAQIKYVKDRVGDDHVAFGSGYHWSYFKKLVLGLENINTIKVLEDKVIEWFGYKFAYKFFWGNAYRFMTQSF